MQNEFVPEIFHTLTLTAILTATRETFLGKI